jgi:hypothetical protein
MSEKKLYPLRGVKDIDGELHIPIFEIINFCRYFPKLTTEQLSSLLDKSMEELKANESILREVPKLQTTGQKRSFIEKWFKK